MHFALLEGRHEHRKDFREAEDIEEIARSAGLDLDQFRKDIADRSLLDRVAEDHTEAVEKLGVFGTPTLVFENGSKFFMRIKAPKDPQESVRIFDSLTELFVKTDAINEVKRPRPVDK